MLLQDSRREARVDEAGELVLLPDQDRARWNRDEIEEGLSLLTRALAMGHPGPYQIQAAIAAVHAEARTPEDTDWHEVVTLYDRLAAVDPSPVVYLNRAVAVSMASGPESGLRLIDALGLSGNMDHYHLWHSARAALLRRLDEPAQAADAYRRALALATNPVDQRFLKGEIDRLEKD
jgi:RNA polymerase sigma-70 factor (ECF subfamily)